MSNESSTQTKRLHPWFKKLNVTADETKGNLKTNEASKSISTTTQEENVSSMSTTGKLPEENKEVIYEISSDSEMDFTDNVNKGTKRKREEINEEEIISLDQNELTTKKEAHSTDAVQPSPQISRPNIKYTQRKSNSASTIKKPILSIADHEEAYPWENEAAKNREKETPLSHEIQKVQECANKLLSPEMKSQLYQNIDLSNSVKKKINDKIEKQGNNYVCVDCKTFTPNYSQTRRNMVFRHVKTELGYFNVRCSLCDEKSNDYRTIVNHYASQHGIPTSWVQSQTKK